jgi:putative transposase
VPNFRCYYVPGGTYFFTVVTHERRPILTTKLGRKCLRHAIEDELTRATFALVAIVLLPDHLHAVWTLPAGDSSYSLRWARIKEQFTREFLKAGGSEGRTTANRVKHRERAVWQHRFWEHTVRDADDLKRCVDYLHYNPVKHGLVSRVAEYPWSTFHKYVRLGEYEPGWGTGEVAVPEVPGAEWE